jgi:hypothetical protein
MIDRDRPGTDADKNDRINLGSVAMLAGPRPITDAPTQYADAPIVPPQSRSVRSRKTKRTQHELGQPVTVEFRDGTRVPATMLDRSVSGLGVKVADSSLFHRFQRVAVRQRGMRAMAEIRNVPGEADNCRLALRLLPA